MLPESFDKKPKTSIKIIEDARKQTHRPVIPSGSQPPYEIQKPTKIRRINNAKQYFVEYDSLNLTSGKKISRDEYKGIKEKYDICMVMYRGGDLALGDRVYYISGKRRNVVEGVAIQNTKNFYQRNNYLQVIRHNNKDVQPRNICNTADENKASMLYLRADVVTATDEGY